MTAATEAAEGAKGRHPGCFMEVLWVHMGFRYNGQSLLPEGLIVEKIEHWRHACRRSAVAITSLVLSAMWTDVDAGS